MPYISAFFLIPSTIILLSNLLIIIYEGFSKPSFYFEKPILDTGFLTIFFLSHLAGGETHSFGHSERRTISLRVVLQARIESEIGPFRVPMPVLDDYVAFDTSRHGTLPDKQPQALNPFDNKPVPYWTVKEVAV